MTIYNNQVFEDMDLYHLYEAFITPLLNLISIFQGGSLTKQYKIEERNCIERML